MPQELRTAFHAQLDEVRQRIIELAAMTTELLPRATRALLDADLAAADALIADDDAVDALALELEEECYRLLALQQPMARDLRTLVCDLRMIAEIERSADLAVNIAKGARRIYGTTLEPPLRSAISRMSEEARSLFQLAIDAYARGDAALAAALDDIDDRLDDLHEDYIQLIFEAHARGSLDLRAAVQLAVIGRYYERIGDHAVNIGERVTYMITGWLPEHSGAARAEARARIAAARVDDDAPGDGAAEPGGADR